MQQKKMEHDDDKRTIAKLRVCVDLLNRDVDRLERQLAQEREAHSKDVDELTWRLDAVSEIANGRNRKLYEDETNGHYIGVTDDSLDVFFTLINEYPIANDNDIVEEYGISMNTLKYIAKVLRLSKSSEKRREARDRLKRHGMDLIERRGGDQGNHFTMQVEKVSKSGKLLATYKSPADAARRTGYSIKTIKTLCHKNKYTSQGFTFRKKQ
jgi:hypothetical protein